MRKLLLGLLAIYALTFLVAYAVTAAASPVGSYTCAGTQVNPQTKQVEPYEMYLEVQRHGEETFEFQWREKRDAPTLFYGLAVPDGDHLAVAIVAAVEFAPGVHGHGSAHVAMKGGKLESKWTGGAGKALTEVCSPAGAKAA